MMKRRRSFDRHLVECDKGILNDLYWIAVLELWLGLM